MAENNKKDKMIKVPLSWSHQLNDTFSNNAKILQPKIDLNKDNKKLDNYSTFKRFYKKFKLRQTISLLTLN